MSPRSLSFRHVMTVILLVTVFQVTCAGDSSLIVRVGTPTVFGGHEPKLVLEWESLTVDIYPDYAHVECLCGVHNDDWDSTVLMGVPVSIMENRKGIPGPSSDYVWELRSLVDGQRVDGELRPASYPGEPLWYPSEQCAQWWYLNRLHFSEQQRRNVAYEYSRALGLPFPSEREFLHDLSTGARWKGTIGRARIVVNYHLPDQARIYGMVEGVPEDCIRHYVDTPKQDAWLLTGFQPDVEMACLQISLRLRWMLGIIRRDGIHQEYDVVDLVDGVAVVPVQYIAFLSELQSHWNAEERSLTLRSGNRSVKMWLAQKQAMVNGESVALPLAPWINADNRVIVPCRAVCEALGWQVHADVGCGVIGLIGRGSPYFAGNAL